ncbi:uracil-DNA glycosylase [Mycoplasma crocodyli]|uniref:Uracil-DNA glycosylase n=1 Tax=Mycoplasma crocodyli (strain ATCC 51981 / MP145) TaxID=512564 RepID=D5E5B7_MYCCM|nr:uracil-DNA glycosylase [Mycoplasma crocodyli]ADE19684.1 uracil-DNA glycosylase [Mycoplasma crocodyli MP145]
MKYSWLDILQNEGKKQYFQNILSKLEKFEKEGYKIFPESQNMFRAFDFFQVNETKVVILGQDPYPTLGVADGLAFSTKSDKTPSSLKNIFKELKKDYQGIIIKSNDLSNWAKQGVLLLNTILTVNESQPNSHADIGWEKFNKVILEEVIKNNENVVFGLLGNSSKKIIDKLDIKPKNVVFLSHPSPLGYHKSFKDGEFFKKINNLLEKTNQEKIDWSIKE